MIISISSVTMECSVYGVSDDRDTYLNEENTDMIVSLPVMADRAIKELGIIPKSVIVSDGPGYYTGTRIGLSFAKGLLMGDIDRMHTVNSLDVLAYKTERQCEISVLLKARREVYHFRRYMRKRGIIEPITEQLLIDEGDVVYHVRDSLVIGEGLKYLSADILNSIEYENIFYPDAKHMYLMLSKSGNKEI